MPQIAPPSLALPLFLAVAILVSPLHGAQPSPSTFTLAIEASLEQAQPNRLFGVAQRPTDTGSPVYANPPPIPEIPALPQRLMFDVVDGVKEPLHWNKKQWGRLGLGVLAVGVVASFDEQIHDFIGAGNGDSSQPVAEGIRPLGRAPGLAIVASTWLAGKITDRPGLQRVSSDALEAAVLSGLATVTVKRIAGRARPSHDLGSSAWQTGEESFPSGEVTSAFALAAVFARHSNKVWIDSLAWTYAGLIGWQRMKLDAHWASDTLAGALIGVAVGRWVVKRNGPWLGDGLSLSPTIGRGEWGVSGSYSFKN